MWTCLGAWGDGGTGREDPPPQSPASPASFTSVPPSHSPSQLPPPAVPDVRGASLTTSAGPLNSCRGQRPVCDSPSVPDRPRGCPGPAPRGNAEAGASRPRLQSPEAQAADLGAVSSERSLEIPPPPRPLKAHHAPPKPTAQECGVPYCGTQLEGSLAPRAEAVEVLAEGAVSGQWVGSGQTALEGAPASP